MIKRLDHLVLTTARLADCLAFYKSLGFTAHEGGGRYELYAGDFKINVHLLGQELAPHAESVQCGSADLCFEVDGTLETAYAAVCARGLQPLTDVVHRTGSQGAMRSFYLRDPDGNLVELCAYG